MTGANLHPSGAWPDEIVVYQNDAGSLGNWTAKFESLYDSSGDPLWLEHHAYGRRVDVVALPLTDTTGVDFYAYDPWSEEHDFALGVSGGLSIVGFPFRMTAGGGIAVWVQGSIATEPEMDFNNLPSFLIDSRTRPGQSGSPVIFYSRGGMVSMADGSTTMFSGEVHKLIGVYSGRINEQSDLGIVWKAAEITHIIGARFRGRAP